MWFSKDKERVQSLATIADFTEVSILSHCTVTNEIRHDESIQLTKRMKRMRFSVLCRRRFLDVKFLKEVQITIKK